MTTMKRIVGVTALLTALYNTPATAQQESLIATYEKSAEAEQGDITYVQTEVIQEVPDYSAVWLDGRVSFVGGEITTSERQYMYAEARGIPIAQTSNYDYLRRTGQLVRLTGPHIGFTEVFTRGNSEAYVLPSTLVVLRNLSEAYSSSGCGRLMVNNVLRLNDRGKPKNASPYSVHSRGMAVDLRINNLSSRCYEVLNTLLAEAEANQVVDATREHSPPHFHVVVIPHEEVRLVQSQAPQPTDGQSE